MYPSPEIEKWDPKWKQAGLVTRAVKKWAGLAATLNCSNCIGAWGGGWKCKMGLVTVMSEFEKMAYVVHLLTESLFCDSHGRAHLKGRLDGWVWNFGFQLLSRQGSFALGVVNYLVVTGLRELLDKFRVFRQFSMPHPPLVWGVNVRVILGSWVSYFQLLYFRVMQMMLAFHFLLSKKLCSAVSLSGITQFY